MSSFSAAILSGGRSRRMGQDKAFLPIGSKPSLERVIHTLRSLTDDLLIIIGEEEARARIVKLAAPLSHCLHVVADLIPGKGTLGGMFTALQLARYDYCIVVGCDMPFLNPGLLRFQVSLAPGYQAVVPYANRQLQPLHAVYHRDCAGVMKQDLQAGHLKAAGFLANVSYRIVDRQEILPLDPQFLSFRNMNTPEDWREFDRWAQASERKNRSP